MVISETEIQNILKKKINTGGTKVIALTGTHENIVVSNLAPAIAKIEEKKKSSKNVLSIDLNFDYPKQHLLNQAIIPMTEWIKHKTILPLFNGQKKYGLEEMITNTENIKNLNFILGDYYSYKMLNNINETLIGKRIDEEIEKLILSGKFSEIIIAASQNIFPYLLSADKYILIDVNNNSSFEKAKLCMINSIIPIIKKTVENEVKKEKGIIEKENNIIDSPFLKRFEELIEKNKSDIKGICNGIKELPGYNIRQKLSIEVEKAIGNVEFGVIPVQATPSDVDKVMEMIAKDNFLPQGVRIFCAGYLNYGQKKDFYNECNLIKRSANSGKPLILHQYDKKSPLRSIAKKSYFVKSIEDIAKYIVLEEETKETIKSMRVKDIAIKYGQKNLIRRINKSIKNGFIGKCMKTGFYTILSGLTIYGLAKFIIPDSKRIYDLYRYNKLIEEIEKKDKELIKKKNELISKEQKIAKLLNEKKYYKQIENENLKLNNELIKVNMKIKNIENELTEKKQVENMIKNILIERGYNDKLQYFWEGNAKTGYLFFGTKVRENISEEENIRNFEMVEKSAEELDKIFGPDFEKKEIKEVVSGKACYKIKNKVYAKIINGKAEGFDIMPEEERQIKEFINKYIKSK
ncbi:MAG: hypothetical protein QW041_03005 [Candidatus Pacearchaeota archaeon]